MAQVIEFGTSHDVSDATSQDGVIKWVHNQTPAAIIQLNKTMRAAVVPSKALSSMPRKPLLFIHNLKPHRKTGK